MVQRTVKFKDFLGNERLKTLYFNFNEAEIAMMEWSKNGGMSSYLQGIVDAQNMEEVSRIFKTVIERSYGEISNDGEHFYKELNGDPCGRAKEFIQSAAYPVFFMDLITTPGALAKFFNELVPASLVEKAEKMREKIEAEQKAREENAIQ